MQQGRAARRYDVVDATRRPPSTTLQVHLFLVARQSAAQVVTLAVSTSSVKHQTGPGQAVSHWGMHWAMLTTWRLQAGTVTSCSTAILGSTRLPDTVPYRGPAAQVDELVAGAGAQLPGAERALCTRRSLYHVLLALEEDRDALMLDGEDVRFCV